MNASRNSIHGVLSGSVWHGEINTLGTHTIFRPFFLEGWKEGFFRQALWMGFVGRHVHDHKA